MFSTETINRCWELAQGRCECQREDHGHVGRCGKSLVRGHYGALGDGGWFAVPWDVPGSDAADNCEALCLECYEQARQETTSGSPRRVGSS
jgi:hypothetical protein